METEFEKPESMRITVSVEGIFDNDPLPHVEDWARIRRKLTPDEPRAYNDFMAVLGEYVGREITLHRDTIYPDLNHYNARVYGSGGREMYVSKYYGDNKVYYRYGYCPKHIIAFDYHTMKHKDIDFVWTYGKTEERGIMELIREYHGYGNGSYYLYSVSRHIVFRREDD